MIIDIKDKSSEQMPMKVIDMRDPSSARAYAGRPPEDTHTKEELAALHRAIHFTHTHLMQESMNKMDEEEMMVRPVPRMPK